MRNILITIKYDGTNFYGWQRQIGVRTVQGELETAISKFANEEVTINGTSRTDRGVHALGQRASFKISDEGIPTEKLMLAVNNYLAGGKNSLEGVSDVEITDIKEMPTDFHARFDSKGKTYQYIIRNSEDIDIFQKNYCYQVRQKLDIEKMKEGASYIVGTHDFKCFEASGSNERETTVRRVHKINIKKEQNYVIIEITGDGFLYNMVRIIAGTLVEVGLGKREPKSLKDIIASKDRQNAGHTAPPQGLYLVEVYY